MCLPLRRLVGKAVTVISEQTALLRLLQLTDSGFPTGGYAFSHGLEGLFALGAVRDAAGVRGFVQAQVEDGLAGIELPAAWHAHAAATAGDLTALLALDGLLDALKPVPVARAASTRVGRRLLESAAPLLLDDLVTPYLAAIRTGTGRGHHAVAFAVTLQAAGLGAEDAVLALAANAVGGYVAAAVRLGVIGQTAAQGIVTEMHPVLLDAATRAAALPLADLGGYLPLVDLAGLRQDGLGGRLFAS